MKVVKDKKALNKIKDAKINVKVPKETYKIRPLQIIPFMDVKEMKIGTAEINGRKTPYVKAKGKIRMTLPRTSDIIKFEKEMSGMKKK